MQLTEEDLKIIKYERRYGIVLSLMLLTFGGILNLIYLASGRYNIDWSLTFIVDIGIIAFSILLLYILTRKYNKDLKSGIRKIRVEKIIEKEEHTVYEVESGALYIPILGDIFPNLWGQGMRPIHKHNLIINNYRYKVDKTIYENSKKGDLIEMYYSEFSETLLSIELKKNEVPGYNKSVK